MMDHIYLQIHDPFVLGPVRSVPRFTGKTRITGKTAEIPERPRNIGKY